MSRTSTLLLVFVLAAGLGAQSSVTMTGRVLPVSDLDCVPTQTHELACTDVRLFSTALDLSAFEEQLVELTAEQKLVLGGSPVTACLIYEVTSVNVFPQTRLDLCGTPGIGCPIRFRVNGGGGLSQYSLFVSTGSAITPINAVTGTLFLETPLFTIASGLFQGFEGAAVDLVIPGGAPIIGLDLWFQAVRRDVGPVGPNVLSNAQCFTVLPTTVLCVQPDC